MSFLFLILFFISPALAADTDLVSKVIDGDTIELANGERVRYIGINTPEISGVDKMTQELGKKAKAYNEKLVLHKEVRLEFDVEERDKYGRLLAYVYTDGNGVLVNAALIKAGFATASSYPPNVKHDEFFMTLENKARQKGRGLWGIVLGP
ncbi:MAG: thermonuclease family protein [Planctomycetota bacterium]|jgi:micrococcal nuclease